MSAVAEIVNGELISCGTTANLIVIAVYLSSILLIIACAAGLWRVADRAASHSWGILVVAFGGLVLLFGIGTVGWFVAGWLTQGSCA